MPSNDCSRQTHTRSHCKENGKKTVETSFTYNMISNDHGNIK